VGALVSYTLSSGSKSITGTGRIGNDGKFALLVNVSALPDGTVTVAATLTLGGKTSAAGSTSVTKNTFVPGSVGLAQQGYVGLAGIKTSAIVLSGTPGFFVEWELDGPGYPLTGDGYFDSAGQFVVNLDFTGNTDGVYYLSAYQEDPIVGSQSAVGFSTPTETLDTGAPTGSFTPSVTLTNNPAISLSLSYGDNAGGSGLSQMRISVDGGSTWTAWLAYSSSYSLTLPSPDATYTVVVQVADRAGNYVLTTRQVVLDRTAAAISASLAAPTNGTSYDVGTPLALTWNVTDANGVATVSGSSEGQTISASGGTIDVDVMNAGTHTVTITARDKAGNVSTKTITFTIHATAEGILNAIYDGARRGWLTATEASYLVTQIQQVIKAEPSHPNMKAKLSQFISAVQSGRVPGDITAAFRSLLLNWANDLYLRL
jgi:hypothetical protein